MSVQGEDVCEYGGGGKHSIQFKSTGISNIWLWQRGVRNVIRTAQTDENTGLITTAP